MHHSMSRYLYLSVLSAIALVLTGCSVFSGGSSQADASQLDPLVPREQPQKFSVQEDGGLPKGWSFYRVAPYKKNTAYRLQQYQGRTVLKAESDQSASGLAVKLKPRPSQHLWLQWEWKAVTSLNKANNLDKYADDAPLRIMVAFDGDRSKLTIKDRMLAEMAQIMSGHEMPYATLMYVWSPQGQLEQIKSNPYTDRVKLIAVDVGQENLGQWRKHQRDLTADYIKAYGYEPGNLIGIALMTDTDNTKSQTKAYYGDIELKYRPYLEAKPAQNK
jgi:hypothetical protein